MAAKKYLSLEEAAQILGVRNDEVMRMREKGDLRGFADRGTWKFKADDVEEAKRHRQPDSSPDVPLMSDDDSVLSERNAPRRGGSTSDSDVRLILDDDLKTSLTGSSGDVPVFPSKKDSDSDVRLVGAPEPTAKKGSDSDVKLIKSKGSDSGVKLSDSDSDVRLAAPGKSNRPGSDSDVRLAAPPGSDSDVKLVEPKRTELSLNDDILSLDLSDSVLLDDDSGIALQPDSGIRLTGDSGLRLSGESGIQLRRPQDSGILLERPGDSGFRLSDDGDMAFKLADDSGVKMKPGAPSKSTSKLKQPSLSDQDLDMTTPMLLADDHDSDRTDPEVPLLMGDDDDDDLMPRGVRADETQAETNVIVFDDEGDDLDAVAAANARKKRPAAGLSSKELDTAAIEMASDDELADEILDVADESFADEELDEVFATDDDEFEEGYSEEGMSAADFSTSRAVAMTVPQRDWSGGSVLLLGFSSLFMIGGAWMACDLLSTVFASSGPVYRGPFVEMIGGFFK